jgi:hypothetical protein
MGVRTRGLDIATNAKRQVADPRRGEGRDVEYVILDAEVWLLRRSEGAFARQRPCYGRPSHKTGAVDSWTSALATIATIAARTTKSTTKLIVRDGS